MEQYWMSDTFNLKTKDSLKTKNNFKLFNVYFKLIPDTFFDIKI